MKWEALPAVRPALAVLAGRALADQLGMTAIPWVVALAACGLAQGGGWGRFLAWASVGLLAGWGSPGGTGLPAGIDRERPVTLVARRVGSWQADGEARWAPFRGRRLRQGTRVAEWRQRAIVTLGPGIAEPATAGLRLRGYMRRAPPAANGGAAEPGSWRLWVKAAAFVEADPGASRWQSRVDSAGDRFRARFEAAFAAAPADSRGAALGRALVLGDGWRLPAEWRSGLRRAGLSHLLALSGLHVGLLAAAVYLLAAPLPGGPRRLLTVAAAGAYLVIAGSRPSLVRAAVMALGLWAALGLGRPPLAVNTLAWLAAAMVVADPALAAEPGFQLTVAATGGILVLSPLLVRSWPGLPHGVARPLAVTVGAQLATLPWALPAFHLLAPLAPLWNLLAVPWAALAVTGALGWGVLGAVWPGAAALVLPVLDLLALPCEALSRLPSGLAAVLPSALGTPQSAALAVSLGRALTAAGGARVRLPWLLAAATLLTGGRSPPPVPELAVLDVGQGESILVRDGREAVLVDGGGWRRPGIAGRVLVPALARLGVRRLRAVALTHPDLDHCAGLEELAALLRVAELWTAPGWGGEPCAGRLLVSPGLAIRYLWQGTVLRVGRWRLLVLHPPPGDRRPGNDRSLVMLAEANGRRVLLTGDLEAAAERRLVAGHRAMLAGVDVLKVAHHGSRTSTTEALLEATEPRLALISAGVRNRYRHPAETVLARLQRRAVRVLRTDRHGMIRIAFEPAGVRRLSLPGSPRDPG